MKTIYFFLSLLPALAQAAPAPFVFGSDGKSINLQTGLALPQAATPASPVIGRDYLYFKSDDNLYMMDHTGLETQITGGGGVGSGTVTSVSVVTAHGLSGTVATPTVTPAITLSTSVNGMAKGDGTSFSTATSGVDYSAGTSGLSTGILKSTTTTGTLTIAVAGDFPTLNQSTSGNAATATALAATPSACPAGQVVTAISASGTPTCTLAPVLEYFGDGSDGPLTCTGSVTLTKDTYYSSAIFGTGCVFKTASFKVFVAGTCDFGNVASGAAPAGAFVTGPASVGNAGAAGGTGGTPPGAVATATLGGGFAGASGASGTATTAAIGSAGGAGQNGGTGGAGAIGGAGTGNAGGTARSSSAVANSFTMHRFMSEILRGASLIVGGSAGAGGSSGGGDSSVSGGGGGSGGSSGGLAYLSCLTVNRSGSTAAGAIALIGGKGGKGGAPASGTAGGGSGGGGGGGGWFILNYGSLTGSTGTNMIDVTGGAGGDGGNGTGSGVSGGGGGGSGSGGRVTLCNVTTGLCSETTFSNNNAATAATNSTGATGTTATTSQVSL